METKKMLTNLFLAFFLMLFGGQAVTAGPVGTAFTYQGRLIDANVTADGLYDFQFKLFDANTGGSKLGADVNKPEVDVIDGYFTVELDFGSVFDGSERWLEIGVREGDLDDPNVYTVLSPRQNLTPAPYAIHAINGGIMSIGGVSNPGGNVSLIPANSINIVPDDIAKTITIGENHSNRTDNPHQVTATQTGALASVDGVSNPGGNVDFIAGTGMTITANAVAKTVTFAAGSGINRVIRGTITFSSDSEYIKSASFSPSIDPSKAVVILPDGAVLSGTSGTNVVPAILNNLTSNSITIQLQRIYIGGPNIISYQIIEYQ